VGTATVAYTTTKFHNANPKAAAAHVAVLAEADDTIRNDLARAAHDCKTFAKARQSEAKLAAMIRQPDAQYTTAPLALMKFATFMARIGTLKEAPTSWKDVLFPEPTVSPAADGLHELPAPPARRNHLTGVSRVATTRSNHEPRHRQSRCRKALRARARTK
jgi:hypothetical protein